MASFHINPVKGEPARCSAKVKCPYGGASGSENHFDSKKDAREFYEKSMESEQLPDVLYSREHFHDVALKTKKVSEMRQVLKHADDYAIRDNLLRNKHVTPEVMDEVWNAKDMFVRKSMIFHPKSPVHLFDADAMDYIEDRGNPGALTEIMKSDKVTDMQADVIADSSNEKNRQRHFAAVSMLTNHNNNLTTAGVNKLAMMHTYTLVAAFKNPKFDVQAALNDRTITEDNIRKLYWNQPDENVTKFVRDHPNTPDDLRSHVSSKV